MVSTLPLLPLILILLALRVVANPVAVEKNIMLARRFSSPGTSTIVDRDRARAQSLLKPRAQKYASAQAGAVDVPATNAVVTFTTTVDVGSTNYTLIIDTGSSNTWIGNDKPYTPGEKSREGGNLVLLQYGSGCFLGDEWIDQVTLGHDLSISDQSIGVALLTNGFEDVDIDGILGIGPVDLTVGTLYPDVNGTVPTVTNNLYAQKKIGQETIGIYFSNGNEESGELTFGGTDKTKYKGEITYTGITTESPASNYWGIDQSIAYGKLPILPLTAGIVDTGTTLILLASDAFKTYQAATGATFDNSTGLLKITKPQYDKLHDLNFYIELTQIILQQEFRLTPNAQIWPRSLNGDIGGGADDIFLIVGDLGTDSGAGLDFINGYAFLERFYSVYDGTDKRVGFAPTKYTNATTN
ncbi:acid protease [Mycena pura]|uniref:Acid protease n=1 Tax=Mycena pura TaxID=153505 RepID=A0AAD6UWJ0_9AGAR|nr:acid protease [Mycena pura]